MALASVELLTGRSPEEKRGILEAVRRALVTALKVPDDDPAVRLIEHPPEHVIIPSRHSDRYLIVEITMFQGRTERTKRQLHATVVTELGAVGIPADDVLVVLHEPPLANWSLSGIPATDTDPGFVIEI